MEEDANSCSMTDDTTTSTFVADDTRMQPVSAELQCGEVWNHEDDKSHETESDYDEDLPITFQLTISNSSRCLEFGCRDASCGVLISGETAAPKASNDGRIDPFFFEKGFYLEAKTGFQIWPGSRILVEALTCTKTYATSQSLVDWQHRIAHGANVLEVGAGIGAVGTCLAAAGSNVLITDLTVLVEHAIMPNLSRNASVDIGETCPSAFLNSTPNPHEDAQVTRIDRGWASAAVLDWYEDVSEQLSSEVLKNIDLIVGCDCMFMKKLVDPLLSMVAGLFASSSSRDPKFLFTYQRRGLIQVFSSIDDVLSKIRARGWTVTCLTWRTVHIADDGPNDVYLFEVSP